MSDYKYGSNGHLSSVGIKDGRPRTVSYVTDAYGQVLSRTEQDNLTTGDPKELSYYFDGRKVGEVGNDGSDQVDYFTALLQRKTASANSPWSNGSSSVGHADFDQSYDPINPTSRGSGSAGSYTVRDGDTLRSIAAMVWGDAAMWYLIADANGLAGTEHLAAGRESVGPGAGPG